MQIPRVFHQIWLGGQMPEKFLIFQETWKNLHPNWKLILWNEKNINTLKYLEPSLLEECSNFSEKSDYLRFCILLEHGGVYIDTDFECLKNIEALLDERIVVGKEGIDSIACAFIGSAPENKNIRNVLAGMSNQLKKKFLPSTHKLGPQYVTQFFMSNKEVKCLPGHFLYSSYWLNVNKNIQEVYAIHHYTFSWQEKKWKSLLFRMKVFLSRKSALIKHLLVALQILINKSRLIFFYVKGYFAKKGTGKTN